MTVYCGFPKSRRLRKRAEYLAVQRAGKAQHSGYFVVVYERGSGARSCGRLGITVSKKVGNAVIRNRVKRVVREFARGTRLADRSPQVSAGPSASWVPGNLDVVVIAKRSAAKASTATLWADLEAFRPGLQQESAHC